MEFNPVKIAGAESDIMKCWPVFRLLRPHLIENEFSVRMMEMFTEGYKVAYIEEDNLAVSAIGYRYMQKLHDGKQIYIDDLTTLEEYRGRGYAGKLLEFVFMEAAAMGYDCVTLDSGPQRHHAHRLYLNKGVIIGSLHFTRTL